MADDSAIQVFLEQVREIVPNRAMKCGAADEDVDYRKAVEFKLSKKHRLEIIGFGKFTGSEAEILKAVQAKADRRAELEA